jgi:tetratricopeptide (TPR) repeat protein
MEGAHWLTRAVATGGGSARSRARAFAGAGTLAWKQADFDLAVRMHCAALDLYRQIGDREGVAYALNNLGVQAMDQGDFERARPLLEESLAISQKAGLQRPAGYACHNLGDVDRHLGEFESARLQYTRARRIFENLGDQWAVAIQLTRGLGRVFLHLAQEDQARRCHLEALRILADLGDQPSTAQSLEGLAAVEAAANRFARAVVLCGAAEALRRRVEVPLSPMEHQAVSALVARLRTQLGDSYEDLERAGAQLAATPKELVSFASDESDICLDEVNPAASGLLIA